MPKKGISSLQDRLHRVEGQIRGVERMITNGDDIKNILTQLQAVISSMESVKLELVKTSIRQNVEQGIADSLDLLK
ncbi:MAG: metal-sensitive transcriptional regulator [Patescibacteria group bacterium]|nr:metal-sensitive transcriptional regulator [Patescibacteria group bacterium]